MSHPSVYIFILALVIMSTIAYSAINVGAPSTLAQHSLQCSCAQCEPTDIEKQRAELGFTPSEVRLIMDPDALAKARKMLYDKCRALDRELRNHPERWSEFAPADLISRLVRGGQGGRTKYLMTHASAACLAMVKLP
jgi:hypothetical protein